jgi:hypothetical protein
METFVLLNCCSCKKWRRMGKWWGGKGRGGTGRRRFKWWKSQPASQPTMESQPMDEEMEMGDGRASRSHRAEAIRKGGKDVIGMMGMAVVFSRMVRNFL